ncbi:MAG: DUF2550 domain-containing protein [Actinobacteria bacterium]|nr:DUF2550 domain-containing protein [Actinomycetota bacterium]
MEDLVVPLTALATAVAVLVLGFGSLVARRLVLSRDVGTFDCSMRREVRGGARAHLAGSWMLGLARYERDRLDWFRFFAWSLRPARSLERGRLVILGHHAPSGAEAGTVLPGWVVVRCAYGTVTVELAMSEGAYNGLAAWVESAPPGQGINVA